MTAEVRFTEADEAVRPQDDLFGHVNGAWLQTAEIPSDLPMSGGFIDLRLEAERQVGEILREAGEAAAPAGSDLQRMGDLFASFMDEERIDALGARPLADDLAAIDALDDLGGFVRLLGRFQREGFTGSFEAYVNTDDRQSDRYIVNIVQGGLGLPDESYYHQDTFAEHRAKYVEHVAAMFRLLGRSNSDAGDAAARVMALESRLAEAHWDMVKNRDVLATYNLMTLDELRSAAPAFDWSAWIDALGGTDDTLAEVLVRQPSYLSAMSEALGDVPLDDWKVWLSFHLVSRAAPYLSSPFVEENFDFYGRTLTGSEQLRERWKRGVDLTSSLVGEAVGAEYVARVFPPAAKAEMEELVARLLDAYRISIERLDWMTDETRQRALAKLGMFRSKIGYPDTWRDYRALEVRRDDLLGNVRRGSAFETARQLGKIGQAVDLGEWFMTPQTVNAYYNPGLNEICFPAAILQPPFFEFGVDPALNYGGIGAVIGHEIGHGFDDQGSQYDGEGNMVNWWTDDDREAFTARANKLIAQYDGFESRTAPGHHVNGALTVGENIGDLGGLTIALAASKLSLDGAEPPVVDGLTWDQRVLYNWALIWRIKVRPELALQLLSVDPHSPAEFRANVVRNLDEFHQAFGTSPDDTLWLDPDDRVHIW